MPTLTVIVVCYRRVEALQRLLTTLAAAQVPGPTDLVLSIDGHDANVRRVCDAFEWPHGTRDVLTTATPRGLRAHILACGDLSSERGDIVVLEDDLLVGPGALTFAAEGLEATRADDGVAGLALYAPRFDESAWLAHAPLRGASDTYRMQLPCSWGQAWTREQWAGFRSWLDRGDNRPLAVPYIERWGEKSWKRLFARYLRATDKTWVYPHEGHTSNSAAPGTHHELPVLALRTPLSLKTEGWTFASASEGMAYDMHSQPTVESLRAHWPEQVPASAAVDLHGARDDLEGVEWVLTPRRSRGDVWESYPAVAVPPCANLAFPGQGDVYRWARPRDLLPLSTAERRRLFELSFANIPVALASDVLRERVSVRLGARRVDPRRGTTKP